VRVCVFGGGSIGTRRASLLEARGCEVVSYDPAHAQSAATEEEALEGAIACVVASPSREHGRQAALALTRGLPTLVEKPLALSAAEAAELTRVAADAGAPLHVGMNLRFHAGLAALREELGDVGDVLRVSAWCGSWLPGWRPEVDYRTSYSASAAQGGGVLLDALHEIDYLVALFGPVASVSAVVDKVSALEIDVEDVVLLHLAFASGAVGDVALDYLDRDYHRGCRVVGSERTLTCTLTPEDIGLTYEAEIEHFLARRAPRVPAAEAVHVLEVADAARASAAQGRRVTVGP
jgi:predicted dehydrogenase